MPTVTQIKAALDVLDQCFATGSRTEKTKLLKREANNPVLIQIVILTYGPQKYNIYPDEDCKGAAEGKQRGTMQQRWLEFNNLCEDLADRKVSGHKAFKAVFDFLKGCPRRDHKWYTRVLMRDLGVGVGAKTINAIWPKLLRGDSPFAGCMLAEKWDPGLFKEPFELWCEPKLDGLRCLTIIDETGKATFYTRGGKVISHLHHIQAAVDALGLKSRVLDGEMIVMGDDGRTDWKLTLSLAKPRKHISRELAEEIKQRVEYMLFDTLPLKLYQKGESNVPLRRRRNKLGLILKNSAKCLALSPRKTVRTVKSVERYYSACLDKGFEGVIVKDPLGMYFIGRLFAWMKIKPTEDRTGTVIGFKIGNERHAALDDKTIGSVKSKLRKFGTLKKTKTGVRLSTPKNVEAVKRLRMELDPALRQRLSWNDTWVTFRTAARLGALEVELDNGDVISIGGGLSDAQREEIWDGQRHFKGCQLDFVQQKDAGDVGAARFPQFLRWRAE